MKLVWGTPRQADIDGFLAVLGEIGERHGSVIQAIDARLVAGEDHLRRAAVLARRAREHGEPIADDPAMELLCYVAGTRQIERALDFGIETASDPVVVVVTEGDEAAAAAAVRDRGVTPGDRPAPATDRLDNWFEITAAERRATTAPREALVVERVALLAVDR